MGRGAAEWGPNNRAIGVIPTLHSLLVFLDLTQNPNPLASRPLTVFPFRDTRLDTLDILVLLLPELPCPWGEPWLAAAFSTVPQLQGHNLSWRGHPGGTLQPPCVPRYSPAFLVWLETLVEIGKRE